MKFSKLFGNGSKNDQRGRSMVEIIGVLAIMGVLSTLSIWWLSFALSKNASNEITAEMTRRAVLISSLKGQGLPMNKEEFPEDLFSKTYAIDYEDTEFPGYFSIILQNVPDKVIEQLIEMHWDLPYNIYINDKHIDVYDVMTDAKGDNKIRFIFDNEFNNDNRPGYPDQDACGTETAGYKGTWQNNHCTCPKNGTSIGYMTTGGCALCGGDSGTTCPTDSLCYQDTDCPSCYQKCANGKCVMNEADDCLTQSSCDGNNVVTCEYYIGRPDCTTRENRLNCANTDQKCSVFNGKALCVDPNCSNHGTWNTLTKRCDCDDPYGGSECRLVKKD